MTSLRLALLSVLVACASASAQTSTNPTVQPRFTSTMPNGGIGFLCLNPGCLVDLGGGTFRQSVTFQDSISVGHSITATDNVTATTLYAGAANINGPVSSSSVSTGTASASTLTATSSITTADLSATGTVTMPGFTASNGRASFTAPPAGLVQRVCTTVASNVALSTLNTAVTVASIPGAFFTLGRVCFASAPPNLSASVQYDCRISTGGTATISARAGIVGLSASSGQWCAEVYGQ